MGALLECATNVLIIFSVISLIALLMRIKLGDREDKNVTHFNDNHVKM